MTQINNTVTMFHRTKSAKRVLFLKYSDREILLITIVTGQTEKYHDAFY